MTGTYNGWIVTPNDTGWICGRINADGTMTSYKFQTQEWAELCRRSMVRMDSWTEPSLWGVSVTGSSYAYQTGATAFTRNLTITRFDLESKPILIIDHNRDVIKLDVPAIIWMWLKTTWIPKAWKSLMWGEKGKQ